MSFSGSIAVIIGDLEKTLKAMREPMKIDGAEEARNAGTHNGQNSHSSKASSSIFASLVAPV